MEAGKEFSIVIPVFNEEFNIPVLAHEIESVFDDTSSYEVIWVDDASSDNSWNQLMLLDAKIHKIFATLPWLPKRIRHPIASGLSTKREQ